MESVLKVIEKTVPISLFNKGLAGKIFSDVKKSGAKVVMKNNSAECVLMSPQEYTELIEAVTDAELLKNVAERLENYDTGNTVTMEEMKSKLDISDADIESAGEVEFE